MGGFGHIQYLRGYEEATNPTVRYEQAVANLVDGGFFLIIKSIYKIKLTNASRGTANAWHFYYALVCVITV
ncbi:hypothetical protein FPT16_17860 [Vibrio cholerae]|nr:hypothetical protein [Vibrio cholerae]